MMRKEFQLRETIFREGEYQKWMYSICEGSVDICTGYGKPEEKKLVTLTAGQFFGEIGMLGNMPRTAAAVAASERVVLEQIGSDDFEDYLKHHPENLQPIMSSVSGRIRELTGDLSMVTKMTNEALGKKARGGLAPGWLAGSVGKLLGRLKAMKSSGSEGAALRKRQQALSGEIPPAIRLPAGTVIFRAGEQADCMYDIHSGSVGIYSDYKTGNEKQLATLHEDEVFGEMGILDDLPRSAAAVCLTDCTVVVIRRENFMDFFRSKPMKVLRILQQMCIRLRNLTDTYLQVCRELEQLPNLEADDCYEDEVLARLEHIHQSHLASYMYDIPGCPEWIYDYL